MQKKQINLIKKTSLMPNVLNNRILFIYKTIYTIL